MASTTHWAPNALGQLVDQLRARDRGASSPTPCRRPRRARPGRPRRERMPPPIVNGMNTSSAVRRASSTIVSRASWRRGDVEEDELVRALGVVARGQLDRIAGVAQVDEVDALHDAALVDVEARDHALEHASCRSTCRRAPRRLGDREPSLVERLARRSRRPRFADAERRERAQVLERRRRRRSTMTRPRTAAAQPRQPRRGPRPSSMPSRSTSVYDERVARPRAASRSTTLDGVCRSPRVQPRDRRRRRRGRRRADHDAGRRARRAPRRAGRGRATRAVPITTRSRRLASARDRRDRRAGRRPYWTGTSSVGRDPLHDGRRLTRPPGARAVEVDDVQPRAPSSAQRARRVERVVGVDRSRVEVALAQAHGLAARGCRWPG